MESTHNEIEYPCTVTVTRPHNTFGDDGSSIESFDTIIEGMTADIQLSLKDHELVEEDGTGTSDSAVWIMYCNPPAAIQAGDRVTDGVRTFSVYAVVNWGNHKEYMMRKGK